MSYNCDTNLVNQTMVLYQEEASPGVDAVQQLGLSLGTGNDVLVAFDIPNSHLWNYQTVANDLTVYAEGAPIDPGDYTFSEGTGTGGRDQIIFDTAPTDGDVLTIDCLQGIPLLIADAGLTVNSNPVERGSYPGGATPLPAIAGPVTNEFSFSTEIKGSAAAVDRPPNWAPLLKTCGFSETINAAANVQYVSGTCTTTVTIYFYRGGTRLEVTTGVRLSPSVTYPAGQIPTITWSGAGRFVAPVERALPTGLVFDTHVPPICENMELTIGASGNASSVDNGPGYNAAAVSIVVDDSGEFAVGDIVRPSGSMELMKVTAIDSDTETLTVVRGYFGTTAAPLVDEQGLVVQFSTAVCPTFSLETNDNTSLLMDVNSDKGIKANLWSGRNPTATMDLNQLPLSEKDFFDALVDNTVQPLAWRLDGGTTNIVEFFAPAARVTGNQTTEGDSRWIDQITFALGQAVINDELTVTCR